MLLQEQPRKAAHLRHKCGNAAKAWTSVLSVDRDTALQRASRGKPPRKRVQQACLAAACTRGTRCAWFTSRYGPGSASGAGTREPPPLT